MATRVTLPPPKPDPLPPSGNAQQAPTTPTVAPRAPVPVAKVQLLNDRGDRRAEAAWLAAAARPGVVELLSTSDDPFTIVTAHAGARTLRTARLDPDAGLALLVRVTQLLSELHHDGFIHGKLTVDHVLIGPGGPVLCSPDGTVTAPERDLESIARCMRELSRQWDEGKTSPSWRPQWDSLALRLEDATDPSRSAIRTTQALRRLIATPTPSTPTPDRARLRMPRGLTVVAAVVMLAIAGIALVPTDQQAAPAGPRIEVDGSIYAIGAAGDDVAHLSNPCDLDAPVLALRPSTGEIWAFRSINDGVISEAIAIVPGATELRSEHRTQDERTCHVAVARGPAGASEIDTTTLMDHTAPLDHATTTDGPGHGG